MSSPIVRDAVKNFLDDSSDEDVVDLSGEFGELKELLGENEIQPDAPWLGIEFIGNEELPCSLSATNEQGLYREIGSVLLHVCAEAKIGGGQVIIDRGEVLRKLFRGRRIGSIVVESVSPLNFGPGATLEFDGGYVSGTITVAYHLDISPGA